jgi:hypothetical protein
MIATPGLPGIAAIAILRHVFMATPTCTIVAPSLQHSGGYA